MRKRLLGSIAAATAGAGAAVGQGPVPPPPAAIAPVGGYYTSPIPPGGAFGPADAGPGMGGPEFGGPGMPPPGMGGPGFDPSMMGGPMPPPGLHGAQTWENVPPPRAAASYLDSRSAAKFWLNLDYLLWFAKAQPTQYPFVTSSAPGDGGLLGRPTTSILHSRTDLGYNLMNGFRVGTGAFVDDCRRFGWEVNGFLLEQKSNSYFATTDSTGQPLLARPFINALTGQPDVLLVSFPTFAAGSVAVISDTQTWGAEGGPITNLYRSSPDAWCVWNINLHTGFRFLQVDEKLEISSRSTLLNGNTAPFDGKLYASPASIEVRDMFQAINDFYGGQVGLTSEVRKGRFLFSATGKFAAGVMHQRVSVNGFSAISDPTRGIASRVPGGLFANNANIGDYNNDEFAVLPEVGLNFGYNWTSWLSLTVGYNFLYVSKVARPGTQYSPVVNPGVVPTSPSYGFAGAVATPNPLLSQDEFWLQGVNFGINIRY